MTEIVVSIRYCSNCGKQLVAGAQFCGSCGNPVKMISADVVDDNTLFCPICEEEVLPSVMVEDNHQCYCPTDGMINPVSKHYLIKRRQKQNVNAQISSQSGNGYQGTTVATNSVGADGIPLAVKHASFPVAIFFPIWLIAHRMGIWIVIMLVAMPIASALLILSIPIIGWIVAAFGNLWVYVHLIRHGNELAWRRGQYRNLDDFYARERKWINAAWLTILFSVMAGCVLGFILGVIMPNIEGNNDARDMLRSLETH